MFGEPLDEKHLHDHVRSADQSPDTDSVRTFLPCNETVPSSTSGDPQLNQSTRSIKLAPLKAQGLTFRANIPCVILPFFFPSQVKSSTRYLLLTLVPIRIITSTLYVCHDLMMATPNPLFQTHLQQTNSGLGLAGAKRSFAQASQRLAELIRDIKKLKATLELSEDGGYTTQALEDIQQLLAEVDERADQLRSLRPLIEPHEMRNAAVLAAGPEFDRVEETPPTQSRGQEGESGPWLRVFERALGRSPEFLECLAETARNLGQGSLVSQLPVRPRAPPSPIFRQQRILEDANQTLTGDVARLENESTLGKQETKTQKQVHERLSQDKMESEKTAQAIQVAQQHRVKALEDKIMYLKLDARSKKERLDSQAEYIQTFNGYYASFNEEVAELQKEKLEEAQRCKDAYLEIDSLTKRSKEDNQEMESLIQRLKETRSSNKRLQRQLDASDAECQQRGEKLRQESLDLETAQSQLAARQTELEDFRARSEAKFREIRDKLHETTESLREAQEKIRLQSNVIADLNTKVTATGNSAKQYEDLAVEYGRCHNDLAQVGDRLNAFEVGSQLLLPRLTTAVPQRWDEILEGLFRGRVDLEDLNPAPDVWTFYGDSVPSEDQASAASLRSFHSLELDLIAMGSALGPVPQAIQTLYQLQRKLVAGEPMASVGMLEMLVNALVLLAERFATDQEAIPGWPLLSQILGLISLSWDRPLVREAIARLEAAMHDGDPVLASLAKHVRLFATGDPTTNLPGGWETITFAEQGISLIAHKNLQGTLVAIHRPRHLVWVRPENIKCSLDLTQLTVKWVGGGTTTWDVNVIDDMTRLQFIVNYTSF